MRIVDLDDFSLFEIRAFLTLAETLNYTKASEMCNITQSSMSRIIQKLENSLGIQLFIRTTAKVYMTPAGRSLKQRLGDVHQNIEKALEEAYRIQTGVSGSLRIGICDGMDCTEELLGFMRVFLKKHPNYEVRFIQDTDYTVREGLVEHRYDLILDFLPGNPNISGIHTDVLFRGELYAYMLRSNPLAQKARLQIEDLRDQNLLLRAPTVESAGLSKVMDLFATVGIQPRTSVLVNRAREMSFNIHKDDEIFFADRFFSDRNNPILKGIPVEGTTSNVYLRYRQNRGKNGDTELFVWELLDYFDMPEKE